MKKMFFVALVIGGSIFVSSCTKSDPAQSDSLVSQTDTVKIRLIPFTQIPEMRFKNGDSIMHVSYVRSDGQVVYLDLKASSLNLRGTKLDTIWRNGTIYVEVFTPTYNHFYLDRYRF